MKKLYVISRDGKSINEFLSLHNLTRDDINIVKKVSDLKDAEGGNYVIVRPTPLAYQYAIRPVLHKLSMNNVTKLYNKRNYGI